MIFGTKDYVLSDGGYAQYKITSYITNVKGKKYICNNQNLGYPNTFDFYNSIIGDIEPGNLLDLFKKSMTVSIKSTNLFDKNCYFITNNFLNANIRSTYIDKETGVTMRDLPNKTTYDGEIIELYDYKYEFDTVTENDFIEPDISDYEVFTDEQIQLYLEGTL